MPRPRPEAELLRCCARTRLTPAQADRVRTLAGDEIDWAFLVEAARRHRLTPLLYTHLSASCRDRVPRAVLDPLGEWFRYNLHRNLRLAGEALRILATAEARGLPLVTYKGPALAAFAYQNLALREFSDIDFLVPEAEVPRANDLLLALGYRHDCGFDAGRDRACRRFESALVYVHGDGGFTVELHWNLTPRYLSPSVRAEDVWARLGSIAVSGRTVATLTPEALLVYLCVHGAKHCWERLAWICDIALLIDASPSLDWGWVLDRARRSGFSRAVLLGVGLASELLGAALPPEVSDRLEADPVARRLVAMVRDGYLNAPDRPPRFIERGLLVLRMRERIRDRIRSALLLTLVPNIGDLAFVRLPAPLAPLYYPLRPIRMAVRYLPKLFRRG
jgi:hypothetical protein